MNVRKLQGEIDKTIKKVSDGVAEFDSILRKVYSATSSNQKEKYEGDLKKEIKKLQRYRDQLKGWIAGNDVKNKSPLLECRKLVEQKMEQFKVCEKETKTKAYSKEGLGQTAKDNDAKIQVRYWTNKAITNLKQQMDQFETDIDNLQNAQRKRKNESSKLESTQKHLDRHRYHYRALEYLARAVENDRVAADEVEKIKDSVEYYIENYEDENCEEPEDIYSSFNLRVTEDGSDLDISMDDSDGDDVSSNSDETTNEDSEPIEDGKSPTLTSQPSLSTGPRLPSPTTIQQPIGLNTVNLGTANQQQPPPQRNTPSPTFSNTTVKPKPQEVNKIQPPPSSSLSQPLQPQPNPYPSPLNMPGNIPMSQRLQQAQQQQAQQAQQQQVQQQSHYHQLQQQQSNYGMRGGKQPGSFNQGYGKDDMGDLKDGMSAMNLKQQQSHQSPPPHSSSPPNIIGDTGLGLMDDMKNNETFDSPTNFYPTPGTLAELSSATMSRIQAGDINGNSSLQQMMHQQQQQQQQQMLLHQQQQYQQQLHKQQHQQQQHMMPGVDSSIRQYEDNLSLTRIMMETSYKNVPEFKDYERLPAYIPKTQKQTPNYYPQIPLPIFENPAIYEKFDIDTLFFIFYFKQGTYQQFLASRELKKQGWRYHKKYLTWFRRHEEPKYITSEYEQGTYVYFDYETGWCQRKKTEFTFEYRFLEDN